MDEGRLAAVKKSQDYNRKFVYVMNDIMKNRQEMYESCLSQERQESRSKLLADLQATRRTVFRNKVLMHCLNAGRKWTGPNSLSPFGAYGGRPIGAFARDIDQTIAWNNPRLRRLRKVERIKDSCLRHGDILDPGTVRQRMDEFFTKSLDRPEAMARHASKAKRRKELERAVIAKKADMLQGDFRFRHHRLPDPVSASGISLKINPYDRLVGISRKDDSPLGISHDYDGSGFDISRNLPDSIQQKTWDSEGNEKSTQRVVSPSVSSCQTSSSPDHRDLPQQTTDKTMVHSQEAVTSNHNKDPHKSNKKKHSPQNNKRDIKATDGTFLRNQVFENIRQPDRRVAKLKYTNRQDETDVGESHDANRHHLSSVKLEQSSISRHPNVSTKGLNPNSNLSPTTQNSEIIEREISLLKRAPTLVLPPIQSKKADVVKAKRV